LLRVDKPTLASDTSQTGMLQVSGIIMPQNSMSR